MSEVARPISLKLAPDLRRTLVEVANNHHLKLSNVLSMSIRAGLPRVRDGLQRMEAARPDPVEST